VLLTGMRFKAPPWTSVGIGATRSAMPTDAP
jgi:hypothetical protein